MPPNIFSFFFFFFFILLLLLSCAPLLLTSAPIATTLTHSRRILHQPFFPQDATPPSETPSPSPPSPQPLSPKLPFSSSIPNQQPFFPSYPSPPPPPSSTAFASFPANISSLSVPHQPKTKSSSHKLLFLAIAAVVSAALFGTATVLYFCRRRRRRHVAHDKTLRSDTSQGLFPSNAEPASARSRKVRTTSGTSSEFLYLGTLVNSGGIDANHNVNGVSPLRKLDSPELHPLPPLTGQSFRQNCANADGGSGGDDDDEEFYSPRGSSGGRESSVGAGSGSRRVFAAMGADNFGGRSSDLSSSSCSSSTSASPTRSISVSISPPVSLSPRSSRPKFPESVAVRAPPPPSPLPPPLLPLVTPLGPRRESQSSSSHSSSPERGLEKDPDASPIESNVSDQNKQSPARISSVIQQPLLVPRASPPPPPPRPRRPLPRPLESSNPSPPTHCQPISKPPVLVTPSVPFVLQNPANDSPIELPPKSDTAEKNEETQKPKLKPLHWDKVRASSDREMVWDQLKSSSFKLDEEMIETLFVVNTSNSNSKEPLRRSVLPSPNQENRVLDPKKSQNIAILLRALNVTLEEVCEVLLEGNTDALGTELLESLLKMAPTKEEERKLKEYKDDSPFKLGPAERFLKAVLDIPFAFKRVGAMLYIANFDSEIEYLKKSFETLEAACDELRNSRMFLKLLEAVLKTGNRMNVGTNRGDAHAFKLDTLLKLVDVKGADGKTTLLHFVVQEIIRTEGVRLSAANQAPKSTFNEDARCRKLGLQVVSGLSSELSNVKKAAAMDSDVLSSDVAKLSLGIRSIEEVVRLNEAVELEESSRKFSESMSRFMKMAEEEIIRIQAQESVALSLVKEITEYFHGNSAKEEAHPFRIFMVVRDFLTILDRVCKEVGMINERTIVSSAYKFPVPVNPTLGPAFSGFQGKQQDSSDDESSSP